MHFSIQWVMLCTNFNGSNDAKNTKHEALNPKQILNPNIQILNSAFQNPATQRNPEAGQVLDPDT
jgi:hypothetical protein